MSARDVPPSDERLRAALAQAGRDEYEPERNIVLPALKRLRLRRHAIVHANEFAQLFVELVRGAASLWSADREEKRDV